MQPVPSDCVDAVGTGVAVPPRSSKVARKKVHIPWPMGRLKTTDYFAQSLQQTLL